MPEKPYLAFVRDPDQTAREAELVRFIQRNPARFLATYRRFRDDNAVGQRPKLRLFRDGFCGPAFLLGPVWFFYRKLWLIGCIILLLEIGLAFLPFASRAGLPAAIACGLFGHRAYVHTAVNQIQKARRADGSLDERLIARYGGVSRLAGWIGGIVYALVIALAIASIVILMRAGQPIPE